MLNEIANLFNRTQCHEIRFVSTNPKYLRIELYRAGHESNRTLSRCVDWDKLDDAELNTMVEQWNR